MSGEDVGVLVEEQAALRRVATLVARGATPEEVDAAVAEEVGRLLAVEYAGMGRYDANGTFTVIAKSGKCVPAGSQWALGSNDLATIVFETGRSARIDHYADATGPLADDIRKRGVRSAVGSPIIVEGRLWGMIGAGSTMEQTLPADTEARLASFTELVAMAVANVESRASLARLAAEQAALRSVATLVARGVPPEEVFAAVAEQIVQLLSVSFAGLGRYERGGAIVAAAAGGTAEHYPVGSRWPLGGNDVVTSVYETARPARIDGLADPSGPIGATARKHGVRSVVAAPVIVEGRLWGVMAAYSTQAEPLPPDADERLTSFAELVATAIANADSSAELMASRARIVAAADEGRRRIERDLHDGAQQRLVHAVIVLKLARQAVTKRDPDAAALIDEALVHTEQANVELRELAHGILPPELSDGGLRAGVESIVTRVSLPVTVDVSVGRLPPNVESTAYFIISEALTNVVKHARAERAAVTARTEGGALRLQIGDNGTGGAIPGRGSGLVGLSDRVEALGGTVDITSPADKGTTILVEIPVRGATRRAR